MNSESQIRDKILELLGRRNHSRAELKTKCLRKDFSENDVDGALDNLEKTGWINDSEFAREFIRSKMNRKWGPKKIRRALFQKGVENKYIDAALQDSYSDNDELILIIEAAKKKLIRLRSEDDKMKRKQKLFNFLSSRGFRTGNILKHLDTLLENSST